MGSKAFESPLISHARMRAMYRALVETRLLGGGKQGPGTAAAFRYALSRGLEACWVGTAIGLNEGDLTIDRRGTALAKYIRGVGARKGTGAVRRAELRLLYESPKDGFAGDAADRVVCAIGAAMAMRAEAAKKVVVAYVEQGEMKLEQWRRVLRAAGAAELPLLIVAIADGRGRRVDLGEVARRHKGGSAPGWIPVILVDGADAVALYRVAQESLGRLRSGGGAVLIECVASGVDPIELLATQMVAKKICTERWAASVQETFRTRLSGRAGSVQALPKAREGKGKTA